jgi:hypothetical protein
VLPAPQAEPLDEGQTLSGRGKEGQLAGFMPELQRKKGLKSVQNAHPPCKMHTFQACVCAKCTHLVSKGAGLMWESSEMPPNILIVGKSGSGKSTSLRNLPRDTTFIIDMEQKPFPFRGAPFKYRRLVPENPKDLSNWKNTSEEFVDARTEARKLAEAGAIDLVVIESFTKWDETVFELQREKNAGWEVYRAHNEQVLRLMNAYKNFPCPTIWTAISEIGESPTLNELKDERQECCAVAGKKWEVKVEKEFAIVLFTHMGKDVKNKPIYQFKINNTGECTAKSPMGMFDDQYISNDLYFVMERVFAYYEDNTPREAPTKAPIKKGSVSKPMKRK